MFFFLSVKKMIHLLFLLLLLPFQSLQDCSFISGQGCLNGVCKYCAMCITNDCILATPYSTGDNEGSTCAVTHQNEGYDFYNYCLSSGTDSDGGNFFIYYLYVERFRYEFFFLFEYM